MISSKEGSTLNKPLPLATTSKSSQANIISVKSQVILWVSRISNSRCTSYKKKISTTWINFLIVLTISMIQLAKQTLTIMVEIDKEMMMTMKNRKTKIQSIRELLDGPKMLKIQILPITKGFMQMTMQVKNINAQIPVLTLNQKTCASVYTKQLKKGSHSNLSFTDSQCWQMASDLL